MIDYGSLRNLYKKADRINSTHQIIAEWNMNKYQEISAYGIYKDPNTASAIQNRAYISSDTNILTGDNYLIYEDNTVKVDPRQEFFSNLTSVFLTNRPDPGIILLQSYKNNIMIPNSNTVKLNNLNPDSPRYYPFSYSRPYDYFNSAKVMGSSPNDRGVSSIDGNILCANPFVVYSEEFPINKITVKVQNYLTVPEKFSIEVLSSSSWQTIFPYNLSSSSLFSSGILNIYYKNCSWSTTVRRLDDLSELSASVSNQIKRIKGLRLSVYKMSGAGTVTNGLELIELSPRVEMDLSQYTESFSFNTSLGDTSNVGLPVGSIVSSTGDISLSNEDNKFLFSSTLNDLKMLNPDTKFSFYEIVDNNGASVTVPIKVMYSKEWNIGNDYSVSIALEDGFKFLRETPAPDLLLQANTGTKLSSTILTILDNAGITGFEFIESSLSASNTGEDIKIKNFFCKKEQTVAEVMEQIAIGTQCSMYFNNTGKFNVLTKERLTEKVPKQQSSSASLGTDMWMIFDEDYTNLSNTASALEYPYTASYNANVISFNEIKINPMTDGEIVYHTYGPRKVPGANIVPENVLKELTSDFPAAALAFSNYIYATKILWTPGNDNSSVMGAANLVLDLSASTLNKYFTSSYTALNEEEAIRKIYGTTSASGTLYFSSTQNKLNARQSMIIFIDRNEGYTFPDFEGYVLIDKEYIKYRGKLYSINGRLKILFTEEEFQQELRYIPKGSSISILGLVVEVNLKIIAQSNNLYTYVVIGDGRGKLGSDAEHHYALAENSDGVDVNNQFKLTLGESKNYNTPGSISATTKFNFIDKNTYQSAREAIGSLSYNDLQSYLGFLKIDGPKSPAEDIAILEKLDQQGATESVTNLLNTMNQQVDSNVPGNFDDYVYMQGERNIYGQAINLDFIPNSISTRMRLYSATKKRRNNEFVMSTNSSIAGIGFGLNANNEGYFVEVESIGAGKDSVTKKAYKQNLRMYKVFLNSNNKYEPQLLFTAPVGAQTVSNTEVQVLKNTNVADPVFELEIKIEQYGNGMRYSVFYGDKYVNSYIEPIGPAININSSKIFMFVRNDSQAIYEWIAAAAKPRGKVNNTYFQSNVSLDQAIESGIIPVNKDFMFKDGEIKYYFNDFARLVRQVKEYDIRFEAPAFSSALIDISRINPEYMIKESRFTSFGAKIIVVNTSSGPILLGEESSLPLYIIGIGLEELSTGRISLKDYYNLVDEKKRKVSTREKNLSIYGTQTFTLDSQYIQTIAQAKNMMRWITKYCNRQRLKMSLEIFPNSLLELGDKVRIYDKNRGYVEENNNFGDRVFVVSSISYAVSSQGPAMNIEIIEVGQ